MEPASPEVLLCRKAALQQPPHSWTNSTPPRLSPAPYAERRTKLGRGLQTGLCVAGACLPVLRGKSDWGRGLRVHRYTHLPLLPSGAVSTPLKPARALALGSQQSPPHLTLLLAC